MRSFTHFKLLDKDSQKDDLRFDLSKKTRWTQRKVRSFNKTRVNLRIKLLSKDQPILMKFMLLNLISLEKRSNKSHFWTNPCKYSSFLMKWRAKKSILPIVDLRNKNQFVFQLIFWSFLRPKDQLIFFTAARARTYDTPCSFLMANTSLLVYLLP